MSQTNSIESSLLTALVSGTSAAALVGTLTYPFDFIKTQAQLNNVNAMHKFNVPSNSPVSIAQLYKGCSALVTGSVVKNSARIFLYHWLSNFMSMELVDSHGNHIKRTTAPRIVIAGIIVGFIETLLIIPFENIKITMVQNMTLKNELSKFQGSNIDITGYSNPSKHHKPIQNVFQKQYISPHSYFTSEMVAALYKNTGSRFSSTHIVKHTKKDALKVKYNQNPSLSFWSTIKEIYSIKGAKGFGYGSLITLVRQTMISTIWLSSYNSTKQIFLPHHKAGEGWFSEQFSLLQTAGLQLAAATAVIVTTQPIDFVKTHMQLKNSHTAYKDSLSTAYRLMMQNGFSVLYRGSFPRGLKVFISGGLSATFYGYFERLVDSASTKTVFSSD